MNFSETLKEDVRERDGNECQFCGMQQATHLADHDQKLHVHHIVPRHAEGNNQMWNLITVCSSCHRKVEQTQGKALATLRESILSEVKEELGYHATPNNRIENRAFYQHVDYGSVFVKGFETTPCAATETGIEYDVLVVFEQVGGRLEYKEAIHIFDEDTGEPAKSSADLPSKVADELKGQMR